MLLRLDRPRRLLLTAGGRAFELCTRRWETPLPAPREGEAEEEVTAPAAVSWLQRESGHPCRAPIGIVGSREATAEQVAAAEAIGGAIAEMGLTLLCGGREGVMEAACRGAARRGGISIGVLPGERTEDANPHVTIPLATGIGVARNALIARAALCLVAVGGGYGTLSEVAFALQFGKPVFGLADPPAVAGLRRLASPDAAAEAVARSVLNLPPPAAG
jgi:uncharacterized protein (TIGR00725 family)